MTGKGDSRRFSYNGSFEGTEKRSYFHIEDIPDGADAVALIHLHRIQDKFSKHETPEDVNQYLDENAMNDNTNKDFYLVNKLGNLDVSRHPIQYFSNPGEWGDQTTLVSGLKTGNYSFKLSQWQDANGRPVKAVPELVKKYVKKNGRK